MNKQLRLTENCVGERFIDYIYYKSTYPSGTILTWIGVDTSRNTIMCRVNGIWPDLVVEFPRDRMKFEEVQ